MNHDPNDGIEGVCRSADPLEDAEMEVTSAPYPAPRDDAGAKDPTPTLAKAAKLPLNDNGNGARFVLHFGADLMSVPRVGWYCWTGKVWALDPDGIQVRGHAQEIPATILDEIQHLVLEDSEMLLLADEGNLHQTLTDLRAQGADPKSDEHRDAFASINQGLAANAPLKKRLADLKKQHRQFARTAGNTARIDAMQTEAKVALARRVEALDKAPLDVNTQAGVLRFAVSGGAGADFSRTADFKLIPHARDQLLTKILPIAYDPAARCPRFEAFLAQIQPNKEMREFLKRWLGLCMTGLTGEQKLVFFYGNGANGKSVLVDLIARLLGDYSATAKIESLVGKNRRSGGDATPDLMPLMGARMVRSSEPERGEPLQEGKIKELTGGEPILVRGLCKDFVELQPQFKLTISGNHKPDVRGTDDGIWRRLLLVPFDVQIPPSERDPDLVEKLFQEGPGILNWLIEGLVDYLESGLQEPAQVVAATEEYRADSDPIGTFLTDCTKAKGDFTHSIVAAELVKAFNYYRTQNGETNWKPSTISRQLAGAAETWRHPTTGFGMERKKKSVWYYRGIEFTQPFKTEFEKAPRDHLNEIINKTSE